MLYNVYPTLPNGNLYNSSELCIALPWVPPPVGWIKINYDAAVGDDFAGIGFIIRDHRGRPLLVVGKRFFSRSCEAMEVQAILEALDVVRHTFFELHAAVEVQTDSMFLLQEVHNLLEQPPMGGFFSATIEHARSLSALRIEHVHREGNAPADWVVRAACFTDFTWG
ncbi:hypothetical protein HPP92_020866 [Vanilla planifolia]|uniref:RNase H type-1 domain-containing protein n=1 Tax=Vanilla planifolia TaxID=51239 RepID=A0A835Q198_VANPL|nr:hypothetical protein HPP92_021214 [Vanilla planifolia]KAG0462390.1 hypothetical protein HPP92_020866 [Vanilla planifolia]